MGRRRRDDVIDISEAQEVAKPVVAESVNLSPNDDSVGVLIDCEFEKMGAAAIKAYMQRADGRGVATVVIPACGCSVSYSSADKFPKQNAGCPCGRHNHFAVRYDIK